MKSQDAWQSRLLRKLFLFVLLKVVAGVGIIYMVPAPLLFMGFNIFIDMKLLFFLV